MPLAKIVYASMTGNTEACADIVADKLEELGFEVELDECSSVDADEMADADLCIVGTYTYGDGELPDEIVDFYEELAEVDLSGKIYGCFGSGDTFYDDFCICVDCLKRNLKKLAQQKELNLFVLTCLLKMKTKLISKPLRKLWRLTLTD